MHGSVHGSAWVGAWVGGGGGDVMVMCGGGRKIACVYYLDWCGWT